MASEVSGRVEAENSESMIEIKIKTMDSQTYTLQVDKQMPVPALKDCVASVTGVVTDCQRLICRGKVLRDDQLLSAYHVEDGHTLHLVVREPAASSSEASPGDSAFDHSASGNRGRMYQLAPGIFVEPVTIPGQETRGLSDVSQLVSDVLRTLGIANTGGSSATRELSGNNRHEEASTLGSVADAAQISSEQSRIGNSNVIPDALDTLSQYLSRMRQEFPNSENGTGNIEGNNDGASSIQGIEGVSSNPSQSENALPTPAALAELLSTTRQMLNQIAEECLPQLARQLENQENLTDVLARANAQAGAFRSGVRLRNLGAYILELGRIVMTLRLGRSPSEAVVNAGPAVYVSPAGPNPLLVQPLHLHPGPRFGTPFSGNLQSEPGFDNIFGSGLVPRRMDVQILRVPPSTPQTEPARPQQSSRRRISSPILIGVTRSVQTASGISNSPSLNSGDGAQMLPSRTMMAGLPDTNRSPPEVGSLGFLYSLLGRSPNLASGNQSSGTYSQVPGDMLTPESTAFQFNVGDSAGTGSAATPSSGQRESASSSTVQIDIFSNGGIPTDQNATEAQLPPGFLEYLRRLYPGADIQVESDTAEGIQATQVMEQAPPSGTITGEGELRVTMEGLFFSAMLRQLMPLISQYPEIQCAMHPGEGSSSMQSDDPTSLAPVEDSEDRTTRHRDDDNPALPNPKRQKME